MNCDELRESYEMYALGALDGTEREELREHLGRGCPNCTAGVRSARSAVALLAVATPDVRPPARLRSRVIATVTGERRRSWALTAVWAAACAGLLVAAFYFQDRQRDASRELARARDELRQRTVDLARLNAALSMLNDPQARQVVFGQGAPQPPRGRVFLHPNRGVLLLASNLPPAPAGKTYEMWVIPKVGRPVPAGLFQSGADGAALHLQPGPVDIAQTGAIAVTLEDAAGAAQPTSQPLIVAAL